MNDTHYIMLCLKDIQGNISSDEKEILTLWLKNSFGNQEIYNQYKKIHKFERHIKDVESIDKEIVWNELYDKIMMKEQNKQFGFKAMIKYIHSIPLYKTRRLGFAMYVTVFLLLAIPVQHYFFSSKTECIATRNKEKRTVILPDQSHVILNYASELKYPKNFDNDERSVYLDGEAFFSVSKNGVPFVIRSQNASVRVLGTEFNVWARDNKTRVAVKNGKVRLNAQNDQHDFVLLIRDQMSCVKGDQKPQKPENIDIVIDLDWLEDKLIFEKTPLSEVIPEIERCYDVTIHLDEQLKDRLLTARFDDASIYSVLDKICLVFHAEYRSGSGVYNLRYQEYESAKRK